MGNLQKWSSGHEFRLSYRTGVLQRGNLRPADQSRGPGFRIFPVKRVDFSEPQCLGVRLGRGKRSEVLESAEQLGEALGGRGEVQDHQRSQRFGNRVHARKRISSSEGHEGVEGTALARETELKESEERLSQ